MDTQALLIWPTLHSIAEPFKLQADTLGVHLKWADDIYTEFFPEYNRDDALHTHPVVNGVGNGVDRRERIYSAGDETFLAMNHSHKPGHPEGLGFDSTDAFAIAAAAGRKGMKDGMEMPMMMRGSSMHGLLGRVDVFNGRCLYTHPLMIYAPSPPPS